MAVRGFRSGIRGSGSRSSRRAWTIARTAPTVPSAVRGGGSGPGFLSSRPLSTMAIIWASTFARRARALGPAPSALTIRSDLNPGLSSRNWRIAVSPARVFSRQPCSRSQAASTLGVAVGDGVVEGGEEACFAVREQVVERAPRDVRARHDCATVTCERPRSATTSAVAASRRRRCTSSTCSRSESASR